MTEFEAAARLQSVVRQINAVKKEYDNKYMFNSQSFFQQCMSENLFPLLEQASPLFECIPDNKLKDLQVEDVWSANCETIDFPMWMYYFENWLNLSR